MMEYKYEVGKKYKTRGGYVAEIWDVDFNGIYGICIVGKIKMQLDAIVHWNLNGSCLPVAKPNEYDLMPPAIEKWVNVYKTGTVGSAHDTEGHAKKEGGTTSIGLLKITVTGDEFEVEKVAI